MALPSMYDITRGEVDPLSDMLKALVELNYHVSRAEDAGWVVELGVHDGENQVRVMISRGENWPTPESVATLQAALQQAKATGEA